MPRPRKPKPNPALAAMTSIDLENALAKTFGNSLQPLCDEVNILSQRLMHLEEEMKDQKRAIAHDLELVKRESEVLVETMQSLNATLHPLPQALTTALKAFLKQLQTMLSDKNSSNAGTSLKQQLQQLIIVLNAWNKQLKTEIGLQRQLLDSMQQLQNKLDGLSLPPDRE
jgi:hypothetical protein